MGEESGNGIGKDREGRSLASATSTPGSDGGGGGGGAAFAILRSVAPAPAGSQGQAAESIVRSRSPRVERTPTLNRKLPWARTQRGGPNRSYSVSTRAQIECYQAR